MLLQPGSLCFVGDEHDWPLFINSSIKPYFTVCQILLKVALLWQRNLSSISKTLKSKFYNSLNLIVRFQKIPKLIILWPVNQKVSVKVHTAKWTGGEWKDEQSVGI